jgi:ribosomal protein S18 acetylase RimI-like enzyme
METEFRRATLPGDLRALVAFDHAVFPKSDWFPRQDWLTYESFWMRVDRKRVGCCAFEEPSPRSLFIASTGILPEFQRQGFGQLMKTWQISYARYHGFTRILTNTRKSNAAMIALNKKFGFRVIRTAAGYYSDPVEPTVVMELLLK